MQAEALIEDLRNIGFSEHEAKIYIALFSLGQATAYEMAKEASVPVPNTYNVIRSLSTKGAVRKIAEKPARFVAVEPSELFHTFAARVSENCSSIISQFESFKPKTAVSFVEIIQDERAIVDKIVASINKARIQVICKGDRKNPEEIENAIVRAAARGVQCLFVHYGEPPPAFTEAGVLCWPHEGNGVRLGMGAEYLTICCDYENALIYRISPDTELAYSDNRSFVYMTSVMIRHEIYMSEIMGTLADEIEQHFGPGLYDLRKRFSIMPLGSVFEDFVNQRRQGNHK